MPKYARQLLTYPAIIDTQSGWIGKWDKCLGDLKDKYYEVEFFRDGKIVRTLKFTKTTYAEIMKGRNEWIKNKILNRSELAGRIWDEDIPQNVLRRRFEQKAYWCTFTDEEKNKIVKEIEGLLAEVRQAFNS
jgi:hypothetical protein